MPTEDASGSQLLTVAEVAQAMRVSKMTVYRLVESRQMAALRFGRSYRLTPAAVEEYLRRSSLPYEGAPQHPELQSGRSGIAHGRPKASA
ncbi:MAG: AlpA family transcriptional regulator [Micrococcaceae bacterium]|jgi:excisionase family DNA binding protein|nr:AlpA family transcriptional regulator [Micrococcaceae bacterium]